MSYLCSPTNSERINISLEACVPSDKRLYIAEDGISYRKSIPFLDKAGFYSGFADAILNVWDGKSIKRVCEVLILVGWLPTATTFQKILSEWKCKSIIPTGVWTIAYIDHSIKEYGGLTNGPGHRCQPWMNRPITLGSIQSGLKTLRSAMVACIDDYLSSKPKELSYIHLHNRLCVIGGVGGLGAQHIIGVASLLNVIPPEYQTVATMAPNTNTAKQVKKLYNLSTVVLEKQKSEIAYSTGYSEKIIECGYCEMFREEDFVSIGDTPSKEFNGNRHRLIMVERKKKPQHPDVYFFGQVLRTVRDGILVEMYRDQNGTALSRELLFKGWKVLGLEKDIVGDDRCFWNVAGEIHFSGKTIFTSRKHDEKYSDPFGKKIKPCVYKRSIVQHSGIGKHDGLEKRLKESKLLRCCPTITLQQRILTFPALF